MRLASYFYLIAVLLLSSGCGSGLCLTNSCRLSAVSFSISSDRTDQAVLKWTKATSTGTSNQLVSLYSGDNADCSGTPAYSFSVPANATQATVNRFENGLVGLIRFSVRGTSRSVPCSGRVYLRNGVVSVSGLASNERVGNYRDSFNSPFLFADINGDGVKDVLIGDSTYSSGRGKISISLSLDGLVTKRKLVEFIGQGTEALGTLLEAVDVTGDGILDIISGGSGAVYVLPGAVTFASVAVAGLDYGYRYYANLLPNVATVQPCNSSARKYAYSDMNGDGLPELVVCPSLLTVGGTANAGAFVVIPTGASLPASGDIEALVGARVYSGDATSFSMGSPNSFNFFVEDVTGDGLADILYANWQIGYAAILAGAATLPPSGTVVARGRVWTYSTFNFLGLIQAVGDFDNDGIKDWAIGDDSSSYLILGQTTLPANGTLASRASRTYTGSVINPYSADLTGDGVAELVYMDGSASPGGISQAGSIYVLLGGALPASGALSAVAHRRYNGEFVNDTFGNGSFRLADFTGDGRTDLVISNMNASPSGTAQAGSVFMLVGDSPLPATGAISTSGRRYNGTAVNDALLFRGAADMNGDASLDLILSRGNSMEVVLTSPAYPASGSIAAAASRTYTKDPSSSFQGLDALDVNADGYSEILATLSNSLGLTNNGSLCLLQGSTAIPASGPMASLFTCFDGQIASGYLNSDTFSKISSTNFLDLVLYNAITTVPLGSAQFIAGGNSVSAMQRRYATRTAWGDPSAPIVFATASDLDGNGQSEFVYFQPSASIGGFTENGAIHVVPDGYLYSSDME